MNFDFEHRTYPSKKLLLWCELCKHGRHGRGSEGVKTDFKVFGRQAPVKIVNAQLCRLRVSVGREDASAPGGLTVGAEGVTERPTDRLCHLVYGVNRAGGLVEGLARIDEANGAGGDVPVECS